MGDAKPKKPWDIGYYDDPERTPRKEGPKAYQGFQAFLAMGADRTVDAVAKKLNKSGTLMYRWATRFHWVERAAAYQQENTRAADEAMRSGVVKRAEDWVGTWEEIDREELKLGRMLINLALRNLDEAMKLPVVEARKQVDGSVVIVQPINPALLARIEGLVQRGTDLRRRAVQSALVREDAVGIPGFFGPTEDPRLPGAPSEEDGDGPRGEIPEIIVEESLQIDAGSVPGLQEQEEVP